MKYALTVEQGDTFTSTDTYIIEDGLTKGEVGERVNLKNAFKWVLEELDYEDFKKIARLNFRENERNYYFSYDYMIERKDDTPEARKEYVKYLLYKLIQNLTTPNVELT